MKFIRTKEVDNKHLEVVGYTTSLSDEELSDIHDKLYGDISNLSVLNNTSLDLTLESYIKTLVISNFQQTIGMERGEVYSIKVAINKNEPIFIMASHHKDVDTIFY